MFPQTQHGPAGWRLSSNQRCCYVVLRLNFLLVSALVNTSVLPLAQLGTSGSGNVEGVSEQFYIPGLPVLNDVYP